MSRQNIVGVHGRATSLRIIVVSALIALGLGACAHRAPDVAVTASSGMHGSRTKLYASSDELAQDSSLVARVRVDKREVVTGKTPLDVVTLSTLDVAETIAAPALGRAIGTAGSPVSSGDVIVVRQFGSPEMSETPAPLLEPGQEYLLFLRLTELPGDAGSQYYVTGGTAGLYRQDVATREGAAPSFVRLVPDSGDVLPPTLTAQAVRAG